MPVVKKRAWNLTYFDQFRYGLSAIDYYKHINNKRERMLTQFLKLLLIFSVGGNGEMKHLNRRLP